MLLFHRGEANSSTCDKLHGIKEGIKIGYEGPRFDQVLSSDVDVHRRSVKLQFRAEDGKAYSVEVDLRCAPWTMLALSGTLNFYLWLRAQPA